MITDIEAFFDKGCGRCPRFDTPDCSALRWGPGLSQLRQACLEAGLQETVKWGHPCYMHAGRNIVIMGGFRNGYRLTFFNAALMTDPEGVMERQGENTRHPDMIGFSDRLIPDDRLAIVRAYLKEAMGYAEAGLKAPRTPRTLDWPDELVEALESDTELAEAFAALTPGRQRSYLFNLNSAKKPETRQARIEKFRPAILAGKGAQER